MLPSVVPKLATDLAECFLVFGNFSLFKTPFLGWNSIPTFFASHFIFYIVSYLLSKTMGCFSGCLLSSAGIQLFCGIFSAFKCSFDEFVGEKVVTLSYSSAILGLPPCNFNFIAQLQFKFLCQFNCAGIKHKEFCLDLKIGFGDLECQVHIYEHGDLY